MIKARAMVKLRNFQGWGDINEMVNWLNPEDPARDVKRRDSLARYVGYWNDNVMRGYFALPCLVCDDHSHFVGLRNLVRDRARYGWREGSKRYALVNNTSQFFEEFLLPHIL